MHFGTSYNAVSSSHLLGARVSTHFPPLKHPPREAICSKEHSCANDMVGANVVVVGANVVVVGANVVVVGANVVVVGANVVVVGANVVVVGANVVVVGANDMVGANVVVGALHTRHPSHNFRSHILAFFPIECNALFLARCFKGLKFLL